jgi:hypothetical protein
MTDVAADETVRRVRLSLKENSAAFVRERHAKQYACARRVLVIGLIFAAGVVAGGRAVPLL